MLGEEGVQRDISGVHRQPSAKSCANGEGTPHSLLSTEPRTKARSLMRSRPDLPEPTDQLAYPWPSLLGSSCALHVRLGLPTWRSLLGVLAVDLLRVLGEVVPHAVGQIAEVVVRHRSSFKLSGGPWLAEELLVLVTKLGADVVDLASRHGGLHDRRYRPGMLNGLVVVDTFFLRDPVVELD